MEPRQPHPPRWTLRFLQWFCDPNRLPYIEGDLLELFEEQRSEGSLRRAKLHFTVEVLKLFRPSLIRQLMNNSLSHFVALLRMHALLSLRSFARYKQTFLINLMGLTLGLTGAMMIFLWVQDEYRTDRYHTQGGRLYQVMNTAYWEHEIYTQENTPVLLAEKLLNQYPGIEKAVTVGDEEFSPRAVLSTADQKVEVQGTFASPSFFDVFTLPLVAGDPSTVLSDPYNIAISASLARKLFGFPAAAMGQTLTGSLRLFKATYTVAGVYEEPEANATHAYDFVVPFSQALKYYTWAAEWNGDAARTYVVLEKNTSPLVAEANIADALREHADRPDYELSLQLFADRYLYGEYSNGQPSGGRITYVRLFTAIAICLLLLAAINFINLSTAQATRKLKEIGVKKAFGIRRGWLALRYYVEAQLLSFMALAVALVATYLLLPSFNALTGKTIFWSWELPIMLPALGFAVLLGTLSGLYPALYLSRFHPLLALKGKLSPTSLGEFWVRKGLVVFQFSLSLIFILGILVVHQQMRLLQEKPLGYQQEQLIHIKASGIRKSLTLVEELRQLSGVSAATNIYGGSVVKLSGSGSGFWWDDMETQEELPFRRPAVGYQFVETMGIEVVEGRTFSPDFAQEELSLVVNEAAADIIGRENLVGRRLYDGDDEKVVVGIVKNFHVQSLHDPMEPMIMRFGPNGRDLLVRLAAGNHTSTLNQIKEIYQTYEPEFPFSYAFVSDQYAKLYKSEQRLQALTQACTGLALFICIIGLLGLTTFHAERNRKSLGIRRVLGASIVNLSVRFTWDFL
ncbi:MAG: ABC transporter permease, partial [Bacteroidota bacterium]